MENNSVIVICFFRSLLDVQAIVTLGTPATLASKEASKTVPIVMANVGEAVDLGIVASLPRPGGNVTGSSYLTLDLVTKPLEVLKEMLPNCRVKTPLSFHSSASWRVVKSSCAGSMAGRRSPVCSVNRLRLKTGRRGNVPLKVSHAPQRAW